MNITAKIKLNGKTPSGDDQTTLSFCPDYNDDRNKEWAKYTPTLSLSMSVINSVAENFKFGQAFTLTFTPEEN